MATYSTVRLERDVAEQLRRLARQLSAAVDTDVTYSDAAGAAASYALEHLGDVAAKLRRSPGDATAHDGGSDK